MKKLAFTFAVAALAVVAVAEQAEKKSWPTPVEIDFTSPLKLPGGMRDVHGLRLNLLYGNSFDVFGIDLGTVGVNVGTTAGLQANAFNWTDGSVYGIQLGSALNYVSQDAAGIQLGGFLTCNRGDMTGFQAAPMNFNTTFTGLQIGALNWNAATVSYAWSIGVANTAGDFAGFELGVLNLADMLSGAQIGAFNVVFGPASGAQYGLFNLTDELDGVQIGLVNMVSNGRIPVTLLFNVGF